MRPKKSPQQKRFGHDRFGYRPTPEKRLDTGLYQHQEGQTARQQLLDKIQYERLKASWKEENRQKGRERWHDLGNKALPRQVTIVDGEREVFFRFHYGAGDDRYLTAQEVRDMAKNSVY